MSALSSFLSSQLKQHKVAIKSPFAKRHKVDVPIPNTPGPSSDHVYSQPVIDIGEFSGQRSSMDFSDPPSTALSEEERPLYTSTNLTPLRASKLQLELDLSPDSEPLSDWFSTSFPRPDPSPNGKGKQAPDLAKSELPYAESDSDGLVTEDEALTGGRARYSQRDLLASLQAMGPSDFGTLDSQSSDGRSIQSGLEIPPHLREGSQSTSTPMSPLASPLSSAISGTTLARQLMANPYILSYDTRSSKYRSFVGLTRSDSTTLPSSDYEHHHFAVDPNAPPIPSNADALYVAPKTPRTPASPYSRTLRRRGSTGTIATKNEQDPISPSTRPSSMILSPTDAPPLPPLPQHLSMSSSLSAPFSPPFSDDSGESPAQFEERKHIPPAIDVTATRPLPNGPPQPAPDATPPSSGDEIQSPGHLEDVLNYYSLPGLPEGVVQASRYQPIFTPITEESLSQLTLPPTPYRNERRESQRSQVMGARSPMKGSMRTRGATTPVNNAHFPSTPTTLPTIQDRPQSIDASSLAPSLPSHRSNLSLNSLNRSSEDEPLKPPQLSTIFGSRQRSGSAPSPIKVVRDPFDRNQYTLAVGEDQETSAGTPTTGGSQPAGQTFPESALTPGWTGVDSPMAPPAGKLQTMPMPDAPMSATLPKPGEPSLATQILLSRAQTTIRDRHSRQGSFSQPGHKRSASSLRTEKILEEEEEKHEVSQKETSSNHRQPVPKRSLPPSPGLEGLHAPPASTSTTSLLGRPSAPGTPVTKYAPSIASMAHSLGGSSAHEGSDAMSSNTDLSMESGKIVRVKSLPPLPSPPTNPPPSTPSSSSQGSAGGNRNEVPPSMPVSPSNNSFGHEQETPGSAFTLATSSAEWSQPSPVSQANGQVLPPPALQQVPPSPSPSSALPPLPPAPQNPPPEPIPTPRRASPTPAPLPTHAVPPISPPPLISPPAHQTDRSSTTTIDALLHATLGAPPPYYSVVDANHRPQSIFTNPNPFGAPKMNPSQSQQSNEGSSSNVRDSNIGPRSRLRPPLPAGPRRPTLGSIGSPIVPAMARDRSGSQSSLNLPGGLLRNNSSRRVASMPMSPRFQPTTVKWKGYSLEVAKWTFSSAQLQAIVSRAIRDSALSSSIRLLKLESLDGEIPEELHRLEMQRTDIKSRYKALTRRRATLFESLTFHIGHASEEGTATSIRIADELKDLSAHLDSLAEELHTTDEQIAQLNTLTQVHSASALSVALRKLNGSLMKQKEENDHLRQQNVALEQERDEAWHQAQQVAFEFDSNLNTDSKRSSRVSAKRKSSIRLSKAGLRSQSRRYSDRSSVFGTSSYYGGATTPLTGRSTMQQDIPPLPPMPRRRPEMLSLYQRPLRSSGALSTNEMTPDSETRELVQVQEELYSMLGITSPGHSMRLKRSHSILGLPSAGLSPPPMSAAARFDSGFGVRQRRSSLPGVSALVDAQQAMDADHNAVLATFATLPAEL